MTSKEFKKYRKQLGKTQKNFALLLEISIKTVHSYEQGWRQIPPHIERKIYFLLFSRRSGCAELRPCWEHTKCSKKKQCPVWEFNSGNLCWLMSGTLCQGQKDAATPQEELEFCRRCDLFQRLLKQAGVEEEPTE